jgi:hypothetical protein
MYYMYLYSNSTPYDRYDPYDGRQEHRVPLKPLDGLYTVRGQDSWLPSITCTLYGCNRIQVRWPALLASGEF